MKKVLLALLLSVQTSAAGTTDEFFFDFNRGWTWGPGSTAFPQWPLYDLLSAVAGINENGNVAYDRSWRHRPSHQQFISGGASLRSEFRGSEVVGGVPNRAEVVRYGLGAFNAGGNHERWYGLSLYIDPEWATLFSSGGSLDPNGAIAFQIHSLPDGGEAAHPPSIYLEIRDNTKQYSITVDYNPNVDSGGLPQIRTRREVGDWRQDIGKWVDWVIHVRFACDGSDAAGFVNVWKDATQVVAATGGNCYNDAGEHFFRFGSYKSWWGLNIPPAGRRVVALHDSVRIGNSTRNFNWARPKRALGRNHDLRWKTAGIARDGGVSRYAGVPRQVVWSRAGERRPQW